MSFSFRPWRVVALIAALCALVGGAGVAMAADDAEQADPTDVEAARARVERLQATEAEAQAELARLADESGRLEVVRAGLDADQAQRLVVLEDATELTRQLFVEAYVTGGLDESERLLASDLASDLGWDWFFVIGEARRAQEVSEQLETLRVGTDAELVALADRSRQLDDLRRAAQNRLDRAQARLPEARTDLVAAEAWEAAGVAIAASRHGTAPAEAWARLRHCESRGEYDAVSPSGRYRGAYQFDLVTWNAVGGGGDPAQASVAEQDARATHLYALRGRAPWPVCGVHLP